MTASRPTSRSAHALLLAATLAVASTPRLTKLTWGLPDFSHPDEWNHFAALADRADQSGFAFGELRPAVYTYPPWHALSLAVALRAGRATGIVDCSGAAARHQPCTLLVGRVWTALLGIMTVPLVYFAGRTWLTPTGALLSAMTLALAPFHVLYSHLINPDVPLTFWVTAALVCALRAGRDVRWLAAAAFFAGLAAATKYPGVFVLGPALAGVVAHSRRGVREGWTAAAAVAAALTAGVLIGCPRCIVDGPEIVRFQSVVAQVTMREGWPGTDLFPGSPVAHRWVYELVALLPYMLGWPLYALAILGAATARFPSWPRTVLATFALPFLLFMGAARVCPARFYLPLLPVLALCAGAGLERWLRAQRPVTRALVATGAAIAFGYTALLGASQLGQIDFSRQRAVAAWLADRVRSAPGPLTIGYPDRWLWYYDGAARLTEPHRLTWIFMPLPEGGREPEYFPWYDRVRPDLLVWPSYMEMRVCRNYPGRSACRFIEDLEAGRLGYRLVKTFETSYVTEGLYTTLDPTFGTLSEVGLMGYRIFERVD